jgi:hypothetical protein
MDRCHWTAGTQKATEFDRGHYHILIDADGNLVRGVPSIKLNEALPKKSYTAPRDVLTAMIGALCHVQSGR